MIKVAAAIIQNQGKTFIAKRGSSGRLAGMWEFPGGKVEPGETPRQCLKRELYEEFGIDAHIGDYIGTHVYTYEFYTVILIVYRVELWQGEFTLKDHSQAFWVSSDELEQYAFAPADLPFVQMLQDGFQSYPHR